MSDDILMIADPAAYHTPESLSKNTFQVDFLSLDEFYANEPLAKRYDEVLWKDFNTHGKYARVARLAQFIAVAVDEGKNYVSSTLIVSLGAKWLVEYVMTDPAKQGQGAASHVLDYVMREAKQRSIEWVILNCDPAKNNGQLPKFYARFGFKKV